MQLILFLLYSLLQRKEQFQFKFETLLVFFFRVSNFQLDKGCLLICWDAMAINILVIFLTLVSATKAKDNEIITSLIQAYSVAGAESKSYFRSHGKALLQQVSMLDSMALAKLGKDLEATDQLASLAVQTILADLPVEYQAAGGLMKLMQSDRPFFRNTIITAQRNLDKVSQGIKKKLAEFKNSNTKTDEDKQRVQEAIKASVSGQGNLASKLCPDLDFTRLNLEICVHTKPI